MDQELKEPLWSRIFQGLVYLSLLGAGIVGLFDLASTYVQIVGKPLEQLCGLFAMLGSVIGILSSFVGAVWLERVAIIFVLTALVMFATGLALTGTPTFGTWFALAFGIELIKRLVTITKSPRV